MVPVNFKNIAKNILFFLAYNLVLQIILNYILLRFRNIVFNISKIVLEFFGPPDLVSLGHIAI